MKTIRQSFSVEYSFPVFFARDVLGSDDSPLAELLSGHGEERVKVLTVIDAQVVAAYPSLLEKLSRFAEKHRGRVSFILPPFIMRGGEICKTQPQEVERIHALVEKHGLCRHSFILAIGGGAVLDAAGFAAATAHRGVRLIRMPTTTLAQNDAGVGVKNGINAFGRKNFTGSFAPPFAVINDFDFLDCLPPRELRAGISEAVKVALIRDRAFFDFLHYARERLAHFEPQAMERMVTRCAELHLEHIATGGDPFEFGSSRPLDFGHWSAHKLEDLTGGEIRHGEAVAIGIALDALYSFHQRLIGEIELRRILDTLEGIGFQLYHLALNWIDVPAALREFREHLGGELSIPLLNGIGAKVDHHEIDADLYRRCIGTLEERQQRMETTHAKRQLSSKDSGDPRYLLS
ncbi:3-dehydroquinate synthase [Geomonas sp. RF6]|uniref:3-dehydroquinate synthase n=1 Tax=Geomonas sp. RF6 TaxID=2897342 RepID=UPI001E312696|nr:3-dehydroquinate synthase [Geomonas sp. RF6]UFS69559.1 3-dehydroquinate synthase [Geomonas sp. RF6]